MRRAAGVLGARLVEIRLDVAHGARRDDGDGVALFVVDTVFGCVEGCVVCAGFVARDRGWKGGGYRGLGGF